MQLYRFQGLCKCQSRMTISQGVKKLNKNGQPDLSSFCSGIVEVSDNGKPWREKEEARIQTEFSIWAHYKQAQPPSRSQEQAGICALLSVPKCLSSTKNARSTWCYHCSSTLLSFQNQAHQHLGAEPSG